MGIKFYPGTKVYVVAPANTATGGPELLHQLVYHLRNDLNIDAYMYYMPPNHPSPVHAEYKQYNNPFVLEIEDEDENLIIAPEVISGINILQHFHKMRKIIWWLSVDNFYLSKILDSKRNFFLARVINKASQIIFKKKIFDIDEIALRKTKYLNFLDSHQVKQADFHLTQSYYAMKHLENNDIPRDKILYLSDYLNNDFLKIETDLSKKENIVVYNPKKGLAFTKKIIKYAPDVKFVPIINMYRRQVIEILQKAKVYIDFGNHPGNDRLPRETAILGCCVITGERGSAIYYEDVSIPEEYKFEDKEENIPKIISRIKDCFENFGERYKDFEHYRQIIKEEPKKFISDLRKISVKVG